MKTELFEDLRSDHRQKDSQRRRDHLTFRGNVRQGRHGWLRLTPAYSLHVVREILEDCKASDWVLDPFSGTGTTLLASTAHGVQGHSVDINPFLVWFGNVKLTRFDSSAGDLLCDAAAALVSTSRKCSPGVENWVPPIHQIEKWWDAPVLEKLGRLFAQIRSREGESLSPATDLLKIAFCRTLIETAHVSFGHQSMSFKKRPGVEPPALFGASELPELGHDVFGKFSAAVREMAASLNQDQPVAEGKVFFGDSRCLERALPQRCYTRGTARCQTQFARHSSWRHASCCRLPRQANL